MLYRMTYEAYKNIAKNAGTSDKNKLLEIIRREMDLKHPITDVLLIDGPEYKESKWEEDKNENN